MQNRRIHLSLQSKLSVSICAIVLLVLVLLTVVSHSLISQTIRQKVTASLEREIELIEHNLETLTNALDDFSVTFSVDRSLQSILKLNATAPVSAAESYNVKRKLSSIFAYLTGGSASFTSVEVAFSDNSLARIGRFADSSMDSSIDLQAIEETKESRHPVWRGPIKLTTNIGLSEDVYTIYKAVYDLDNPTYLGCIILHVDTRQLDRIFEIVSSDNVQFQLLQHGSVISDNRKLRTDLDFDDIWISTVLFPNNGTGFTSPSVDYMNDWLAIRYPIGLNEWEILGTMPTTYMEAEIRYLSASIYGVGGVAIVLALIFSIVLSRSIMAPVVQLMYSVEQLPLENGISKLPLEGAQENTIVTGQDLNLMIEKTHQLMTQIYNNQKLRNTLQFQVMQAQIKPHFLYNALEAAASMISLGMTEEATAYIQSLSTFYRISLSSGRDVISLEEELQLTKCYLDIQKFRYFEFFDYTITTDQPYHEYKVPKLLLQPLVENAIYHGCKNKGAKGHIRVSVCTQNNHVILAVQDDGTGISEDKIHSILKSGPSADGTFSYGLSNIIGRLQIIFNGQAQLSIESELNQYTKVIMTLPGENKL